MSVLKVYISVKPENDLFFSWVECNQLYSPHVFFLGKTTVTQSKQTILIGQNKKPRAV